MERVKSTRVEIFGSEYHIRADADADYVKTVAVYVDAKMQEIAQNQSLVSSTKVAILAAINIADELFKERRQRQQTEEDVTVKADALAAVLSRSL
ncbi:MAG TPA: cell division protein ZapA [Candidatus Krumholzibacteria bacterium]|nr:cell division protein ZapA [Candidatus Krumholzibacteria bacterium]